MTLEEIRNAFTGVWLLFIGRAEGLALMDRSVAGFWRSFLTILLVMPTVALADLAHVRISGEGSFAPAFLATLPLLALDFALLPLGLAAVAKPLGLTRTYVDFVVARNWGAPVASALLAVPLVLNGAGWIGAEMRDAASLVLFALVLRYQWMALRLALRAEVAVALAVLVADVVISLALGALVSEG
jgi:hypothetical protein